MATATKICGIVNTTGEAVTSCFGNTVTTTTAAGTAYTLTATPAALDFGTTDPVIVLTEAGDYLLRFYVVLNYVGATFATSRDVIFKLRRTNNTAADVTGGSVTLATGVVTTLTLPGQQIAVVDVPYTTANTNDSLTIFGSVSVLPSAGSVNVSAAQISAALQP